MPKWFIVRRGKALGPFSVGELSQFVTSGELSPADLVRRDDMKAPTEAGSIKGLFPEQAEHHDPASPQARSRLPLIVGVSVGAVLLLSCCGGLGFMAFLGNRLEKTTRAEMAEGDSLWDKGNKEPAAAKYRAIIDARRVGFVKEDDRPRLFGRVIDYEYERGVAAAGRGLIEKAEKDRVVPAVSHAEAKAAVAAVQAEKARAETDKRAESHPPVTGFDTTGARRGGFINATGKVVIEYQFDVPSRFADGLAPMRKNGKWGYIDRAGQFVIKPRFDRGGPFSEGLAGVQLDGKYLCIDKSGAVIFTCEYPVGEYAGGRATITKTLPPLPNDALRLNRWLYGLTDKSGRIVAPPRYSLVTRFSDGRAVVWLGDAGSAQCGVIDADGKYVVEPSPMHIGNSGQPNHIGYSEGLVAYGDKSLMLDGYLDINGNKVIPAEKCRCEYTFAARFSDGLAKITRGAGSRALSGREPIPADYMKVGFIDRKGNEVIPPRYAQGGDFSEGLAAVLPERGGKWGYIDKKGRAVIEPRFDDATEFVGGVARVKTGGKYGLVDSTGRVVAEPRFGSIGAFSEGLAWFELP